jgi:predicted PurR-regulated permease PerM
VLFQFRLVVFSLFVAIVVSTAMSPLVDWLQKRGLSRVGAVVLVVVAVAGLAVGLGLLIGPAVVAQGGMVASRVAADYQDLLHALRGSPSRLVQRVAWQLPASLAPPAEAGGAASLSDLAPMLTYAGLVGDGLFVFAAVLLLAFYWTLERERVLRALLLLLPLARRDPAREFIAASEAKVGAYLRGVAFLCVVVGGLAALAFSILGLPSALALGLAAGLFEAVPLAGPVLGALPAAIVAFSIDPATGFWTLGAIALIQVVENAVLVPRIMSRAVGVHPLVTLLALAAFTSLFGLAGAVLAIPLAAVLQMVFDRAVFDPAGGEPRSPQGRDRLSVLRYEVRALVADVRKQVRDKTESVDEQTDRVEESLEAIATDLDSLLARWAEEEPESAA